MTMLASPETFFGQLQRGQGRGFLRALQEDVSLVGPLLLECVRNDPRWDRQSESRSTYYALLFLHTGVSPEPLEEALRTYAKNDTADAEDAEQTILETLGALAVRGERAALDMLRRYLTYGENWEDVFETLQEYASFLLNVDEVSRIFDRRFPNDDKIEDEGPFIGYPAREMWRSLSLMNPRVSRILRRRETKVGQRQRQEQHLQACFASLSTADIFAEVTHYTTVHAATLALQKQVTPADFDLVLRMAQEGGMWQRAVAFRGLQHLADARALQTVEAFFESDDAQSGPLYGAAFRALVSLPSSVTLPLARAWFDAPGDHFQHLALGILEKHATVADVQMVRGALQPSLSRQTWEWNESSLQESMLDILARFPEAGPYPESEIAFKQAPSSSVRSAAARVLATSDQHTFAHGLAQECLWDCEEEARLLGCMHADLVRPTVLSRIQALAGDPWEEKEVSDAAQKRLALHDVVSGKEGEHDS